MNQSKTLLFLKLVSRLAVRQLFANPTFAISMVINMALGLVGFLVVDGFNRSFREEIGTRTRQIASADVTVSARQPFDDAQSRAIVAAVPTDSITSSAVSLVSMMTGPTNTRLIEANFIDSQFPLYAGIKLKKTGDVKPGHALTLPAGEAWVYREIESQMGLTIGDTFTLGEATFKINDVIEDDPTSGSGGFSFAPKVFIGLQDLPKTKLLGLGSRSFHTVRIKLPPSFSSDVEEEKISEVIKMSLKEMAPISDLRVRSHRKVTEDLTKLQAYLNDYLSLIALCALFLAAVGTSYLMRGHLQRTIKEFAIMGSLGASHWIAPMVFVCQCIILGLGATMVSAMIASVGLPILAKTMTPISGGLQHLILPMGSIIVTSVFSIFSGLLLTLPQLLQLSKLNPGFLFQESVNPSLTMSRGATLAYVPAMVLWWITAVRESRSWTNGSVFALACLSSAAILTVIAFPLLKSAVMAARKSILGWHTSLALRQLSRNRAATISTFLALALGTSLINLIPQLRSIVVREIARPDSSIPQLFVFDIQDDQVESVTSFFQGYGGTVNHLSPMVRARLESINDEPIESRKMDFEGEGEQQQRESLQARTQNLSYRSQLSSAETIIKGQYPSENFSGEGLPALSIEEGFAKRVNVKLGDRMKFDITGVPMEGVVTSFRKVRWTSFEPNFMILVQPGVLNDAPKVWVTSATQIPVDKIDDVQAGLIRRHSNVSVVDVKSAIRRLLSFIDQVSGAVGLVAWLALIGGAGVLYAIAYAQSIQRYKAMAILKTLGASSRDARTSVMIEYGFISTAAVLFGVLLGAIVSWVVAVYIFKAQWQPVELKAASIGFALVPVCLALAWIASRKASRASVASLLN